MSVPCRAYCLALGG